MSGGEQPRDVPWLGALRAWPAAALEQLSDSSSLVRILVAHTRGSAPREGGVSMLVSPTAVAGTIGGGHLEWQAIHMARALLAAGGPPARLERLVLGADLGQCCGGVVDLWMECLTAADRPWLERAAQSAAHDRPLLLETMLGASGLTRSLRPVETADIPGPLPRLTRGADGQAALLERLPGALPALWLFGAGYVGQAVARLFMELPVQLTWVDAREELFPTRLPGPVRILAQDPVASVALAPAGAQCLVMTHSHVLDYALCRALLERNDFAWLGLIGSKSKAARFRSRLARDGIAPDALARLVCPIGVPGIESKWPAAIAVSIAAQLLALPGASVARSADITNPSAVDPGPGDGRAGACAPGDCARCGPHAGARSRSARGA